MRNSRGWKNEPDTGGKSNRVWVAVSKESSQVLAQCHTQKLGNKYQKGEEPYCSVCRVSELLGKINRVGNWWFQLY